LQPPIAIRPKRFLEAVIVLALVILALEMTLAWAGLGEQEYLQIDPIIGWTGFPNKHLTWRREGCGHIQLNRLGWNDRERSLEKPKGTKRVLMLGDSLLESLQVDRPNNFCSLLERQLSSKSQPTEVINSGASSYHFGQMYLRLKGEGLALHPDLVVLVARPDSVYRLDPGQTRGIFGAAPSFQLSSQKELTINYERSKQFLQSVDGNRMISTAWLREHSHVWGVLSLMAYKWWAAHTPLVVAKDAPTSAQLWPVADSIIAKMNTTCEENGIKMLILLIPTLGQENATKEIAMLKETANEYGIPLLDASDSFKYCDIQQTPPFFSGGHYTPYGHQLVAQRVGKLLSSY
jgi:lysophospholipase L1-like esterase